MSEFKTTVTASLAVTAFTASLAVTTVTASLAVTVVITKKASRKIKSTPVIFVISFSS